MSLITATDALQTNTIDTISGTTTLNLGGTNATAISLQELTTATAGILTNSINPSGTNDIVIGSAISSTNIVYIGKSGGAGVPVQFPSYVQTNQLNPVSTTGKLLIGTVNGANSGSGSTLNPAITIGKSGSIIRINERLHTDYIEASTFEGTLEIGLSVDTELVKIKGGTLLVRQGFVGASNTLFINDGTNCYIDTDSYPLYIAPSVSVYPESTATSLNLGNTAIPVTIEGSAIGIGTGGLTPSTTTLNGLLSVSNGVGTAGTVLTSGGSSGDLSWETRTVIQSGETAVGAMTSAVTGTVSYGFSYASKPQIQLTMNLNGTGTTIIPVAVSSDTIVAGQYIGFTWIAGTTSATATISWYVTIN